MNNTITPINNGMDFEFIGEVTRASRYECSGVRKGCLEATSACQFNPSYVADCPIFPGRYQDEDTNKKLLESYIAKKRSGRKNEITSQENEAFMNHMRGKFGDLVAGLAIEKLNKMIKRN